MLEVGFVIKNRAYHRCNFCLKPIDITEAEQREWKFCPCCGRELWNNETNPWR